MDDDQTKKPSRWRGRLGWLLFALGAAERIIGWGGSLDFLVSRSEDPGWISDVLTFIGAQSAYLGFVSIMAGAALIFWNERRRTARLLEERFAPLEPRLPTDSTDADPAVRRLNAVVRIEDLTKFRTVFRRDVGTIDATASTIMILFYSYAEREDRHSKGEAHPIFEGKVRHPLELAREFIQGWDQDIERIVAETIKNLGDNYRLAFDQPRLDVPSGSEPNGLDMNALLCLRAFRSRSANFAAWSAKVRHAIPSEIEHLNAVRRGEA